jgi:hypothetical protein
MGKKVFWYTLAQRGSEPSDDAAESVTLDYDDTIAISDLKRAILELNTHTLPGIDARNLDVFEHGQTENMCKPRTKLNACTSGSDDVPFWIFYPGTAAEQLFFLKHTVHSTLHDTPLALPAFLLLV